MPTPPEVPLKRTLSLLSLVALFAPLAASAAPPTKEKVDTLMAALGKVTISATPIGYSGGESPSVPQCAHFVDHVKAQVRAVVSASESAYALLEHLSKAGKGTLIRCSSVRNGTNNLGHTWWTTGSAANVKTKAGATVAECKSVVSLQQWQACVGKLTEGASAFTAPEAVHAFSLAIQDVVIGLDHDTAAKAKPPTTTQAKFVSLNTRGTTVTKATCGTAGNHTVDEDFGVILFHELIHASRMVDGKFIGGRPASEATAADRNDFVTFVTTHNLSATVAAANVHRDKITLEHFKELATNGGYDHEELQTVLTSGAVVGVHKISENQIRAELNRGVYRCHYSR